jgi:AhpD family alkylhydroperoxidase
MNTPTPRITYTEHANEAVQGWLQVERFLASSGVDHVLLELMRMRASQINGCAFCLDMHATNAFKRDVPPMKLIMLDAWEEAPNFTDRERAALAWTDAVTRITDGHVPDEIYNFARSQFSEAELVTLTICVAQINAWNRIAISMRAQPAGASADKRLK